MVETSRSIRWDSLESGMIIQDITELSIDYASLDPDTLDFIQKTFRGSDAVVIGEEGEITMKVADLQPFDNLHAIRNIPNNSTSAVVVPGMPQFLEQHGLLAFKISEERAMHAVKGASILSGGLPAHLRFTLQSNEPVEVGSEEAEKQHEIKRAQVKFFLDTLETAMATREEASELVEDMLDQGRKGMYTSKGVEKMVDEIIQAGSAPAMKAIAGLRGSDQTYAHCTDMSIILEECYVDIVQRSGRTPSDENARFALLSGFMHDIGKSEVSKEVLESNERFAPDSKEMMILRNHTTYGARILQDMNMSDGIINVASYHHVKIDPDLLTSYPNVPYEKVLPFTRLSSITDVYQALIGNRRYKRNWVPGHAVQYMQELKGSEFDPKMLKQFLEVMGIYPVGSLVKLSTGEMAFVLMIGPKHHPDRPIVSIVENADGDMMSHHTLLDLMLEPEITLVEVVDHFEHYNDDPEHAARVFQSITIN